MASRYICFSVHSCCTKPSTYLTRPVQQSPTTCREAGQHTTMCSTQSKGPAHAQTGGGWEDDALQDANTKSAIILSIKLHSTAWYSSTDTARPLHATPLEPLLQPHYPPSDLFKHNTHCTCKMSSILPLQYGHSFENSRTCIAHMTHSTVCLQGRINASTRLSMHTTQHLSASYAAVPPPPAAAEGLPTSPHE
jgi:hypothetical protein